VVLPVARDALSAAIRAALDDWTPDAVIAVGQATGRARVDVELVAHNALDYKGEADNAGHVAAGEPLVADGPERLVVPLDLEPVCDALAGGDLPIGVSRDAGRHLCNALLYELLHRHPSLPAFFVHVPLLPEQAARRARDEASLPIDTSTACLAGLIGRLPGLLDARA
jgi:pyroglutamyl-peptidase